MDLDTENRLASLLMEEARRLRMEADKEGVHVYLHRKVRTRPNSRFLTSTVLGVQQANKAVEVDEMWRAREKELELDNRLKSRSQDNARKRYGKHQEKNIKNSSMFGNEKTNERSTSLDSSGEYEYEDRYSIDDNGLGDEDIEKFLKSRAKRGRGAVGPRMDEPGPYPSSVPSNQDDISTASEVRVEEEWERRALGPEKPPGLNGQNLEMNVWDTKQLPKQETSSSKKRLSKEKRHRSKEEKLKLKKRKKDRRSRHHSRSP